MASLYERRSANFSDRDIKLLIRLVHEKRHIIENKSTDGVSIQEKDKEWVTVTKIFNYSTPDIQRNIQHFKNKWNNLKKDARKYNALIKKQKYVTGGGPRQVHQNESLDMVVSIIGPSATGYDNKYDCDATLKNNKVNTIDHIINEEEEEEDSQDDVVFEFLCKNSDGINNWNKWSKKSSKDKISPLLTNSINKVTKST